MGIHPLQTLTTHHLSRLYRGLFVGTKALTTFKVELVVKSGMR